jgi:hypothetical protein
MVITPGVGNSLEKHLKKFYPGYYKLPGATQKLLLNYCVQYLFRFISAAKFNVLVRKATGDSKTRLIEMRRSLTSDGYLAKNIKVWLYYLYKEKPKVSKNILREFEIQKCDHYLHRHLNIETITLIEKLCRKGYKAKTLKEIDQIYTYVLEEDDSYEGITKWTSRFVGRKMRFIADRFSETVNDMVNALKADGLESIMFVYPRIESLEHCINICKRAIHNDGINLIERHTSETRGRITMNADGSANLKLEPLHSPNVIQALENGDNHFVCSSLEGSSVSNLDLRLSVQSILSQYSGSRRRFIHLITGEFDEAFSKFLKDKNPKLLSSNDQYFDRVAFDIYLRQVLDYIGVSEELGLQLIEELKIKFDHLKDVI